MTVYCLSEYTDLGAVSGSKLRPTSTSIFFGHSMFVLILTTHSAVVWEWLEHSIHSNEWVLSATFSVFAKVRLSYCFTV